MLEARSLTKYYGAAAGAARRLVRRPARPNSRLSRPQRLRQVDDGAHARRADGAEQRRRVVAGARRSSTICRRIAVSSATFPRSRSSTRISPRPEYLRLVGGLRGVDEAVARAKIDRLLELLGLADDQYSTLSAFSKGMRQKVLLASALLHNPELIILDEPFSGLDVGAALMLRASSEALADEGRTILMSSHVIEVVEQTVHRRRHPLRRPRRRARPRRSPARTAARSVARARVRQAGRSETHVQDAAEACSKPSRVIVTATPRRWPRVLRPALRERRLLLVGRGVVERVVAARVRSPYRA